MQHFLAIAATTTASPSLLSALGIDVKLLIEQAVAFLILVAILGKFVYPTLIKAIDARRDQIESSIEDAKQAEEALVKAEAKANDLLAEARKEADDIIARSQQETAALVADAEEKAKVHAEQIIADARTQLESDVRKARAALKADTIELVALATERIVGEKLDGKKDADLITNALSREKA